LFDQSKQSGIGNVTSSFPHFIAVANKGDALPISKKAVPIKPTGKAHRGEPTQIASDECLVFGFSSK